MFEANSGTLNSEPTVQILQNPDLPKHTSKLTKLIPLEIRQQNYEKVRNEIFNDSVSLSKNIVQTREVHKDFKRRRQEIQSVILNNYDESNDDDNRPSQLVKICYKYLNGLLDSGASISCLGKNTLKFLEKKQFDLH